MKLGVVVGLAAEARMARGLGNIETGGGTPEGAEQAAERLVARDAQGLLSFGLAGGLDPALRPGAILIPEAVTEAGRRYATDPDLCRRLGGPTAPLLLAGTHIVAESGAKAALWRESGAGAVDLESGAVARVAHRHGLPFAVLRAICDPAERSLPLAALVALDHKGAIGAFRILGALLRRPWEIPALLALAGDAAHARRALLRAAGAFRA
jgi:adenosylhomocysteine nucleosidase